MAAAEQPKRADRSTTPVEKHPEAPRRQPKRYVDPVFELEPFPFGD